MITKTQTFFTVILILLISFPGVTNAQSLWEDSQSSNLYSSKVGHKIGDIITIMIMESTTATNKASTQNDTQAATQTAAGTGYMKFIPLGASSAKNSYKGSGTTTRSGSISGTISAKIVKIFPNGIAEVKGSNQIIVNNEKQKIFLSGKVRLNDINSDNSVYSTSLSDAKISYKGRGSVGRSQRPGIIHKLFDWIF